MTLQPMEKLASLNKTVAFLEMWRGQVKKESLVDKFFNLVVQEKKKAANVILDKIKQKSEQSLWRKGYITALEGMAMLIGTKNDQHVYINKIKVERSDEIRKVFLKHSNNELHSDFDKGFFFAWVQYMLVLKRMA